eukprot:7682571-Ditylum_brightwellii.AAC.1
MEESVKCKPLDAVHNAQYTTAPLGIRKSYTCFLEPSWVASIMAPPSSLYKKARNTHKKEVLQEA